MRNYGREVLTERYQVQNLNRKKIILFINNAKRINISYLMYERIRAKK